MRYLVMIIVFSSIIFAKEYKIGFSQDTLANDFRAAQVMDVKMEVSKYPNLKLDIKDAHSKLAKQISDIEYFIHNNYDFIITSPINAKVTAKVLKKAIDKNIKVILIDRGVNGNNYTTFIAPNNYDIAKKAGNYLAKKLNCKGTILVLEGIKNSTPTILRNNGFMDSIKNCKNIKLIKRTANFLRSDAIKVMEDIYKKDIKFDAIYSHSDSMLSGVRIANEKYTKSNNYISVGIDYIKEAKVAISKGKQTVSFTYDTCGKEGVESIVKIIKGKKVPKDQILESTMVTKKNVKTIKPIF